MQPKGKSNLREANLLPGRAGAHEIFHQASLAAYADSLVSNDNSMIIVTVSHSDGPLGKKTRVSYLNRKAELMQDENHQN